MTDRDAPSKTRQILYGSGFGGAAPPAQRDWIRRLLRDPAPRLRNYALFNLAVACVVTAPFTALVVNGAERVDRSTLVATLGTYFAFSLLREPLAEFLFPERLRMKIAERNELLSIDDTDRP